LARHRWVPWALCVSLSALAAGPAPNSLDGIKEAIRLKQFSRAATDLQRLADAGNPEAQYLLGVFYLNGLNGPRDSAQARMWMQKAAAQGHARAISGLNAIAGPGDGTNAGAFGAGVPRTGGIPGSSFGTPARLQDFPDATTRHEALWLAGGCCYFCLGKREKRQACQENKKCLHTCTIVSKFNFFYSINASADLRRL